MQLMSWKEKVQKVHDDRSQQLTELSYSRRRGIKYLAGFRYFGAVLFENVLQSKSIIFIENWTTTGAKMFLIQETFVFMILFQFFII